jgi:hypothetical protein
MGKLVDCICPSELQFDTIKLFYDEKMYELTKMQLSLMYDTWQATDVSAYQRPRNTWFLIL